ncbi:MAG: hypothetical protein HC896_02590 [Bacteroidales bacterium]|nr:hypothetical protein [Bacteroidales bacterium]
MAKKNANAIVFGLGLVLLVPALFYNLGLISFIEDEGTRGIVALEMIYSGNYVVPTISGEFYFNKPPLYNWLIALSFKALGSYSNFALRLPMAICLLLYALTVFVLLKRYIGRYKAGLVALATITSARVLFYDSLHGLIDIAQAWLTFTMFVLVYRFRKDKKPYLLFSFAYVLSATTYLMKGLPAIAFLGLTLLVLAIYTKNIKQFFKLPHFIGIALFVAIIGGYYWLYYGHNPDLKTVFHVLFNEAGKKTVYEDVSSTFFLHLFVFPANYIKNFVPWTLFVVLLFYRHSRQFIMKSDVLRYLSLIFFVNILVYWLSPVVYPRYLLMFVPVSYAILIMAYYSYCEKNIACARVFNTVYLMVLVMVSLAPMSFLFIEKAGQIPNLWAKAITMSAMSVMLVGLYFKSAADKLLLALVAFIMLRISFNLFVLPIRHAEAWDVEEEKKARAVGRMLSGKPLYIYDEPSVYHEDDKELLDLSLFYVSAEKGEIVKLCKERLSNTYYLVPDSGLHSFNYSKNLQIELKGNTRGNMNLLYVE